MGLEIGISVFLAALAGVHGHGRCRDPVHRGSAWRDGFDTPVNYNDMEQYCGGVAVQYEVNGGRCGACGDSYSDDQPRRSENGGLYGTGTIVQNYTQGQAFTAIVRITSNHRGYFTFALCPLDKPSDIETEECFKRHPILTADGQWKYVLPRYDADDYAIELVLPEDLTCEHCALRWQYTAGNNWGMCENGRGAIECGKQETFRTCSDIAIYKK
ncbi:uncharacterized protein LOC107046433 isoform X2 [Diachasma alloeum]|uniref:uncharacterized protein LOC107046433 isoform X2 n=1 Tax=Diachasma alloeum TaxID=454923 RepID=UPI000738110B|nr:uncharacterized protein LOC107046433 isoform X2 [Diachasma alloeum]